MNNSINNLFPSEIRTAAITAPAGPPDPLMLETSLQALQNSRIKVKSYLPESAGNAPAYLSAEPEERIRLLNAAINDPEVDMIICARGGFGSVHLLDHIDYTTLRQRQLPVMGYSDITALHCAMLSQHAGIPVAGSNLLSITQASGDAFSIASHHAALDLQASIPVKLPAAPLPLQMVIPQPGKSQTVSAKAFAANLTVLASLCGSKYLPHLDDMILIIEDVNEPVYKLDRMLSQLAANGVFDGLAALVFGIFTGCDNDNDMDLLQKRIAGTLSCPCWKNFQFGHVFPMCAINACRKIQISPESEITILPTDQFL